jgi:hypothetical protein
MAAPDNVQSVFVLISVVVFQIDGDVRFGSLAAL